MDFVLDKYDLFNAPQYVDFNEFVKNDGSGIDNADDFFRHHREEDDFFPNGEYDYSIAAKVTQEANTKLTLQGTDVVEVYCSGNLPSPVTEQKNTDRVSEASQRSNTPSAETEQENTDQVSEASQRSVTPSAVTEQENTHRVSETSQKSPLQSSSAVTEQEYIDRDNEASQKSPLQSSSAVTVQEYIDRDNEASQKSNVPCAFSEQGNTDRVSEASQKINTPSAIPEEDKGVTCGGTLGRDSRPVSLNTRDVCPNNPTTLVKTNAIPSSKKLPVKITIPQPFKFAELRPRKTQMQTPVIDNYKFKAKPAPVKILKGESVQSIKFPSKFTHPKEIHFASEDRIQERNLRLRKSTATIPPEKVKTVTRSGPSVEEINVSGNSSNRNVRSRSSTADKTFGVRARSLSADRARQTHVQPFSFEERDKEVQKKKEEKLRNAMKVDAKLREFHAQPIPKFDKHLLRKLPAPVTAIKPFKLKCDERGVVYQQEFQRKVEEESKILKQQAEFTAQPNNVVYRKPFEPEKSNLPLAEPLDIVLHTDLRVPERSKYDLLIKRKEAELEQLRKQEQRIKEDQEKQLLCTRRQMCVHKAKPAPKTRIFEIKTSEKPLTEPKSPAFELLPSQRRSKFENKENNL